MEGKWYHMLSLGQKMLLLPGLLIVWGDIKRLQIDDWCLLALCCNPGSLRMPLFDLFLTRIFSPNLVSNHMIPIVVNSPLKLRITIYRSIYPTLNYFSYGFISIYHIMNNVNVNLMTVLLSSGHTTTLVFEGLDLLLIACV